MIYISKNTTYITHACVRELYRKLDWYTKGIPTSLGPPRVLHTAKWWSDLGCDYHVAMRNTKTYNINKLTNACISKRLRNYVSKLHSFTKFMMLFWTVLMFGNEIFNSTIRPKGERSFDKFLVLNWAGAQLTHGTQVQGTYLIIHQHLIWIEKWSVRHLI